MADFEDTFTGTLDTNLTDHTPDVGTAWTGGGSTTDNARLNGNGQLKAGSSEGAHVIRADDLGSPDHQVWMQLWAGVDSKNSRVVCRAGSDTSGSYGIGIKSDPKSQTYAVDYRDSGSTNNLLEHDSGLSNPFWVKLKAEGDTVSVFQSQNLPSSPEDDSGWTFVDSWTQAVANTEQRPGMFLFGDDAVNGTTDSDPWIDNFNASALVADTTAPTLSSATVNDADLTLTYNEALDESSVPATGDFTVTVSSSGTISVSNVGISGMDVNLTLASAVASGETVDLDYTPGTNPIRDEAGNDAASLTDEPVTNNTSATAVKGVAVTLYDRATQSIRASVTGIVARWWDSPSATGAPVFETSTASTDSNGVLELDLDSDTGLDVGQNGYLVLYKEQGDPESDWHFAARVAVEDIS